MIVRPTAVYPASRWSARRKGRHAMRFMSGVPLLFPGVGVVVVATILPVSRLVAGYEANSGEPLRALPEVQIGDERAHRRAVRPGERRPFVAMGDEDVRRERLLDEDVRRVSAHRLEDHVTRRRAHLRAR